MHTHTKAIRITTGTTCGPTHRDQVPLYEGIGTLLVTAVNHIRYGLRQGVKAKPQKGASRVRGGVGGQRAVGQRAEGKGGEGCGKVLKGAG